MLDAVKVRRLSDAKAAYRAIKAIGTQYIGLYEAIPSEYISNDMHTYIDAIKEIGPVNDEVMSYIASAQLLIHYMEQLGIAEDNLSIGESMAEDTIQAADFEAHINGVVKAISSITSVAFGFSMIGNAIKTLTDDSATLEEKLNAIIMNGTMGLTMLLPGIISLTQQLRAMTVEVIANSLG
jgi:hypothetical protein